MLNHLFKKNVQENKSKNSPPRSSLRYDIIAGITVALVAIPQALAYAELAGMPPQTGVLALAVAAVAASFFASSPYIQVGPVVTTSLLTLGILGTVANPGSSLFLGAAALLALIVGVVRVLIGLLRMGAVAHLLAQPVLLGFVSAAAVIIVVSQIPGILGLDSIEDGMIARLVTAITKPSSINLSSLVIGLLTILLTLLGRRIHPLFPGVLVALVVSLGYSRFIGYNGPTIGELELGVLVPTFNIPLHLAPGLLMGGIVIALLGFSEAASIARTYAIIDRRAWDPNREFISQGAANLASGIFGGFPVGASFSRSAINRMSGAKTRWSGLVTGLAVLFFLPFIGVLSLLPKATLAGIIIASVISLVRLPELLKLFTYSKPQAYIAWTTFALTLVLSPRIDHAILIGIGLAIAHHLRREQRVIVDVWREGETLNFRPRGVLWFGSAPMVQNTFNNALERHSDASEIVLHLGSLGRIDLSAAIMLKDLMEDARKADLQVKCIEIPPMAESWSKRVWGSDGEQ